jgi:predicted transcriptional regulator
MSKKAASSSTPKRKTAILRGRVPLELKKAVNDLAERNMSSEAQIVRQAVSELLNRLGQAVG